MVNKTSACWLWLGSVTTRGYPRFKEHQQSFYAHRYSLKMKLGRDLKPGEQANHHCDVKNCVRPDHLFEGTQKDNIRDAMRKGRMAKGIHHGWQTKPESRCRGERSGLSKLHDPNIREIHKLRKLGLSQQKIANQFNVSQATISSVLRCATWSHINLQNVEGIS